uniref:Uncharacterized protein n=1 Tax=Chromera velia CCMP2878 TaxID=1169474 RepID=A0A0G4G1T3_9ALVE|eukprot:Cvel_4033.t1-p1 / transcript=Cvel_4033.t1 / gene=Cvel_4033 / organism=Chromera_velia_CCMP2878 / gene_product=hypothetical protein / transcript_product=hypothetical protein / location=Cvel_scaffold171:93778-95154(-) / protein_length=459 / sequence_SO=supercontig / SO=protein_coding / is_pseudo=false
MCKTTKGDEAAPKIYFPQRAAPKDVRTMIKEEIAAFVGGGGNPRRDQVRRTKPASNNSRKNPRHSQQQSFEGGRKCWRCGIIGYNPDTCKSHEKPWYCDCYRNKGHWKATCRYEKCKRDRKAGGKDAGGSKETGRNRGKNNQRANYLAESIVDKEFSEFPFAGDACTVAMQCSNCRHDVGRAMVNTRTNRPLVNRAAAKKAEVYVWEWTYSAQIGVAKHDGTGAKTGERVMINVNGRRSIAMQDASGGHFLTLVNFIDDDVPHLITWDGRIALDRSGETPSWFKIFDVRGVLHHVVVDAPDRVCCSRIPSFHLPLNAADRFVDGEDRQQALSAPRVVTVQWVESIKEARVHHERLGIHSGAEGFRLTLEDTGYHVPQSMAEGIYRTCRTCQQKQAVQKSLQAATGEKSRRGSVKKFGDEVYLDIWFPEDEAAERMGFPCRNLFVDLHSSRRFDSPMRGR